MTGLARAVRYLTIVPVPERPAPVDPSRGPLEFGHAAAWFPLVGLALGLVLALAQWVLALLFPPLLVGLLTVAIWKLLTGGLHLDGVADCLDGLGGRDPEHRLAIMHDGRIGAFAAIGLTLLLLVDVVAVAEMSEGWRWRALVVAPMIARAAPAMIARLLRPARGEGHGARFTACVNPVTAALAAGVALLVAVLLLGWRGFVAAVAGIGAALLVAAFLARRLGGFTGDVLGAAVEVAEAAVLLAGAGWAHDRP